MYLSCQVANCSDDCYDIHNPTSDLGDKEHMREKLLLFAVRAGGRYERILAVHNLARASSMQLVHLMI
jgi:hypothetical protein